jgi:PKD repeat protein
MAPCAVQFNAQQAESLKWAQVRDSGFTWNFGDGGPTAEGFLAAHVFDQPGTYSVGLTVNGTPWSDETITVRAPKRTICVSPTASFGDCPSASRSDHFTGLGSALGQDQTNVHVLLHRGEDFGSFGAFANDGPTLYGAYGSGAKPTMRMNTEETMGSNVVWQDLDISVTRVLNLSDWSVLRRIDASGTIGGSPDYWVIAYYVDDFFVLDCIATVRDGGNGGAMYVSQAQRSAVKGNSIYRRAGDTGHTIRTNGSDGFLIQDNVINEDGGPDSLTIRGDNDGSSPSTRGNAYWTLVQGNTFKNVWPVIKPQFPEANELVQYVIWEKNVHSSSANLRIETAHDVLVRNNVFRGNGAPLSLVDNSDHYDSKRIWVIDNTCGAGDCAEMILP